MPKSITLGRLRIDIYQHAIYLQKLPNPQCVRCHGAGHVVIGEYFDHGPDDEYEPCRCWKVNGGLRIPLVRRVPITERYPF